MVKNGNFTLLLTSGGQEWQFHIATDIQWSKMAISHYYRHLVVKNGNFTLLLTSNGQERQFTLLKKCSGQEWQFHIATDIQWSIMAISHYYRHLVVKNGNFTLLLTSNGQEWQFTLLQKCSGQEWQFHIATDIQWSIMAISHYYRHLVVKNGNFTLLLTSNGQEWQFTLLKKMQWSRMAISHCY